MYFENEPEIGIAGKQEQRCSVCGYLMAEEEISALEEKPISLRGDVDENGGIDFGDYVFLKRAYFGTYSIPEEIKFVY